LADVAGQTISHTYRLALGSENKLQIHVQKFLLDDAYLS
jgi:hypothetical protein